MIACGPAWPSTPSSRRPSVTDSTAIELQGRPGLEYRGAIGEAGAVLGRTYVDGPRVCNLLVVGEPPIVADVAPAFLDSFEFLQEAA